MNHQKAGNYLRAHRKKSGLSQRDVAKLIGYKGGGQISCHERGTSVPSLAAALAYESIFGVPVATIFADMHDAIRGTVEAELKNLTAHFESRDARGQNARIIAQKLVWLNERQEAQLES